MQLRQLRPVTGSVSRWCQDIGAGLHIQSTGLLQHTTVWHVWRVDASSAIGPERRRPTCNRRAAPWPHHADSVTAPLAARASTSELQDRCLGLSVWPARHRRITRRLRSTDTTMCVIRRAINSFGNQCFAAAGLRLWNRLKIHLQQCDSLEQFKWLLKTHLFGACDCAALWRFN